MPKPDQVICIKVGKVYSKYRIPSNRHQDYDYSSPGAYYITICTANKECYFGKIVLDKMELNRIGEVAREEWLKTPAIRSEMNIVLDEFCIMPNHFHGIIIFCDDSRSRDAMHCVSANTPPWNTHGDAMHCVSTP